MIVLSYKHKSKSARKLAEAFGCNLMKKVDSKYKGNLIINWGTSRKIKLLANQKIINRPESVKIATNKISTLQKLEENNVPHPPFTTDKQEAQAWLDNNCIVFARTANGKGGKGIQIVYPIEKQLPDAELYTKYIKSHEYRVHVFNGNVIDVRKKRKKNGADVDQMIKSHGRGWVFCKKFVEPEGLRDVAIKAINALGLDFGAVDILHVKAKNRFYVLEVNTAPGLTNSTAESYKNAIESL